MEGPFLGNPQYFYGHPKKTLEAATRDPDVENYTHLSSHRVDARSLLADMLAGEVEAREPQGADLTSTPWYFSSIPFSFLGSKAPFF